MTDQEVLLAIVKERDDARAEIAAWKLATGKDSPYEMLDAQQARQMNLRARARLGGIASAAARKAKSGTAQPRLTDPKALEIYSRIRSSPEAMAAATTEELTTVMDACLAIIK